MVAINSFCEADRESATELFGRLSDLEERVKSLEPKPRKKSLPKAGEEDWVSLRKILGTSKVPKAIGDLLEQCIDTMTANGDLGKKNKFQVIEYLCAEFLAGEGVIEFEDEEEFEDEGAGDEE